jgi:hypothetical protein
VGGARRNAGSEFDGPPRAFVQVFVSPSLCLSSSESDQQQGRESPQQTPPSRPLFLYSLFLCSLLPARLRRPCDLDGSLRFDPQALGRRGPDDIPIGFEPRAGAMALLDQRPRHRENRDTPIEGSPHEVRSVRSTWKSNDEPWTTVAKHELVSPSLGILAVQLPVRRIANNRNVVCPSPMLDHGRCRANPTMDQYGNGFVTIQ